MATFYVGIGEKVSKGLPRDPIKAKWLRSGFNLLTSLSLGGPQTHRGPN